jgi:hypothetical protein
VLALDMEAVTHVTFKKLIYIIYCHKLKYNGRPHAHALLIKWPSENACW